jgi:hypothetical protein
MRGGNAEPKDFGSKLASQLPIGKLFSPPLLGGLVQGREAGFIEPHRSIASSGSTHLLAISLSAATNWRKGMRRCCLQGSKKGQDHEVPAL